MIALYLVGLCLALFLFLNLIPLEVIGGGLESHEKGVKEP